ncbi:UNVERIFIED_CONTAM: hypothetical protein HHA_455600 [Hammondia hammondi]|eukprot:XP_008888884.1 hypothetical protein HHA_455600 [Hammondia hammondi]
MCRVHSLYVSPSAPPTPHRPLLVRSYHDSLKTQHTSRPPDPSAIRMTLTDCSQSRHNPPCLLRQHPTHDEARCETPDSRSELATRTSWPLTSRPPTSLDTSTTSHCCLPSRTGPTTSTSLTLTSTSPHMCRVHSLHISPSAPPTPHRPLLAPNPPLPTAHKTHPPVPTSTHLPQITYKLFSNVKQQTQERVKSHSTLSPATLSHVLPTHSASRESLHRHHATPVCGRDIVSPG